LLRRYKGDEEGKNASIMGASEIPRLRRHGPVHVETFESLGAHIIIKAFCGQPEAVGMADSHKRGGPCSSDTGMDGHV
jgi:hypothetical protein